MDAPLQGAQGVDVPDTTRRGDARREIMSCESL